MGTLIEDHKRGDKIWKVKRDLAYHYEGFSRDMTWGGFDLDFNPSEIVQITKMDLFAIFQKIEDLQNELWELEQRL